MHAMSEIFQFGVVEGDIDVEVSWNPRRKTRMGLLFDPEGKLLVDAPPGTTLEEVRTLLGTHERWIRYRSRSAMGEQGTWFPRSYENGVLLFYRGNPYALNFEIGKDRVWLEGETLQVRVEDARFVSKLVWDWYRSRAGKMLGNAVEKLAESLPWVEDTPLWRHRFMRSQWGSCTGGGRISLNSHLVKLEDELVEYVVLHECCHLQYLNHGPRFYRLMDFYMLDWKDRRRKINGYVGMLAEPFPVAWDTDH